MAALLFVLAIIGAAVIGNLVWENTATGTVTVLDYTVTGYSHGLFLAMAAGIGFVVGLLLVGSVGLRRSRRARRKQLRSAERELLELEDENARLRDELRRQELAGRRVARVAAAADLDAPATARRAGSPLVDGREEPVYSEARRVARLRGDSDPASPSTYG
jgi:hypothetical protein